MLSLPLYVSVYKGVFLVGCVEVGKTSSSVSGNGQSAHPWQANRVQGRFDVDRLAGASRGTLELSWTEGRGGKE